jgi:hypothetical protein
MFDLDHILTYAILIAAFGMFCVLGFIATNGTKRARTRSKS